MLVLELNGDFDETVFMVFMVMAGCMTVGAMLVVFMGMLVVPPALHKPSKEVDERLRSQNPPQRHREKQLK